MKKPQPKQKPSNQQYPVIAKGNEKAVVEKLVRAAKTYDEAWQFIHKTFPRKTYGRVRDVVQKFSQHKTLRAAFNALHGKKAKRGGKAELQRAA
jgi:hypothetical protein